ncbi:MAG: UbiD family decarboxylase [Chloroflexi bacterium]|nr:UbiD family decarboxylase [Chloroflexota bacterium]
MPWRDFRSFLSFLEEKGDLVRVSKEVSTRFQIAAYTRKSSDTNGPAFIFDNVAGYPGWRVAAALYATPGRIVDALETKRLELIHKYMAAMSNAIEPKMVEDGPCQEVVLTGSDVDLNNLPICTHAELDAGPFITAGVVITKDPVIGVRLLSINRMQVFGPRELGVFPSPHQRLWRAIKKAAELGQTLEAAVAIGVDPAVELGSLAKIDHSLDKYGVAGALHGSPIELVKCRTVDIEVPATTEVVIEAEIFPNELRTEGPFGEFPGTYSGTTQSPVVRVKAITHRENPIYHTAMACMPVSEDHLMSGVQRAIEVYRAARMACPEIVDVRMRGNHVFDAVVSIRKRLDGEARNVIVSVLGATHSKYCTVVDEDIDIYNDRDIIWAMETRVQPDKDVYIYPPMVGGPLDPSSPQRPHSSKMGIDATLPLDAEKAKFQKVVVPGVEDVTW